MSDTPVARTEHTRMLERQLLEPPDLREADPVAGAPGLAPTELVTPPSPPAAVEEPEARFRLLVESVKDYAIFVLDPEGHVRTWNAGAERIKGYSAAEIVGQHFSVFYPPEVAATGKCASELAAAARNGRFEEEGWRVRRDGSRLWANVTITALRDPEGALVGFAKVTQDLTERRRAAQELLQLTAERATLAERVHTQEFQERFLAILGHDLRNPLAALQMGSMLLRQRLNDAATLRTLDRMDSSSQRMARMIEQIIDLTRSRLGGPLLVNRQPMDLCDAVTAMVEEWRAAYPSRDIALRCPPLLGVWDRDRLEQVFSNLIGNALLHGDAARPVTVEGRADGDRVRVDVHNDGPPIPDELKAALFNPFRRGDQHNATSRVAGLGLGLYISHELALAHGGTLEVESSAAHGTTFRVTLPATLSQHSSP